jgi:hypothetical protein
MRLAGSRLLSIANSGEVDQMLAGALPESLGVPYFPRSSGVDAERWLKENPGVDPEMMQRLQRRKLPGLGGPGPSLPPV